MNIIILIHQRGSLGYSMNRYETVLKQGLEKKKHNVEILGPKLYLSSNKRKGFNKWLRYIDVYILFPIYFKIKTYKFSKDTLYVLIDQALGIWTPLIKNKKHIVHCHDFIALKSSLGIIPENLTSKTGKIYQKLILKGFSKAKNFISISKNTQNELHKFLEKKPNLSSQIYNPIDPIFKIGSIETAKSKISKLVGSSVISGYILHVGGNTFYKNRCGVIQIYNEWRKLSKQSIPLLMIGSEPTSKMQELKNNSRFKNDIYFLTKVSDETLVSAYQGASIFIFPSLLEGFGFPVAEAMACGCPVVTTNSAPMNEVGGDVAFYIQNYCSYNDSKKWSQDAAIVLDKTINILNDEKQKNLIIKNGLLKAEQFNEAIILNQIENVYKSIL